MASEHGRSRARGRLRNLSLALGAAVILFWLPLEDLDTRWAVLVAASICLLFGAWLFQRFPNLAGLRGLFYPTTGALCGLAVTPTTLLLMLFKGGLHAHEQPDFTVDQMRQVIERTPVWVISGLLIALGYALWQQATHASQPS